MTFLIKIPSDEQHEITEFPDKKAAEAYIGRCSSRDNEHIDVISADESHTVLKVGNTVYILLKQSKGLSLKTLIPGGILRTNVCHNKGYHGISAEYIMENENASGFTPGILMEKKDGSGTLDVSIWNGIEEDPVSKITL